MENRNEYKKFIAFTFDEKDIHNPIKPTNYVNENFNYNYKDLWSTFLNEDGFVSTVRIEDELKPVQDYIINQYKSGIELLEILHKLAESYTRNLDSYHTKLICESIEFGRNYNNIITNDTLQKGIYKNRFQYFAHLIAGASKSRWAFRVSNYNEDCEQIYLKNLNIFNQIRYLDI